MRHLSLLPGLALEPNVPSDDDFPGLGRHVLVVDEGVFTRRLTRRRLERGGFTVSFVEELRGDAEEFDAVVVAAEALPTLDGRFAGVPVLVTAPSGTVDVDELESILDFGASLVIDDAEIADAILEALWSQPSTRS